MFNLTSLSTQTYPIGLGLSTNLESQVNQSSGAALFWTNLQFQNAAQNYLHKFHNRSHLAEIRPLQNEWLFSTTIGFIASTIAYFAAEYFYPAQEAIYEVIMQNTAELQLTPETALYDEFLHLVLAIKSTANLIQINLVSHLNSFIAALEHIFKPENIQLTSLDTQSQVALKKLLQDYLNAKNQATEYDYLLKEKAMALDCLNIILDALNQIILKSFPINLDEPLRGSSLEQFNILVNKITWKVIETPQSILIRPSRESISQKLAILIFTISSVTSLIWLKMTNKN